MKRLKITAFRPVRNLLATKEGTKGYQKQNVERYLNRLVLDHPEYQNILRALAEGVPASRIAAHLADQQLIDVHEKTFHNALIQFKKSNPEALRNPDHIGALDKLISPKLPPMDVRQSAMQLLRVQKDRIAVGFNFEKATNVPTMHMHKEIDVARELIETIAKIEGKIGGDTGKRGMEANYSPDVAENLGKLKQEQVGSDRMHNLVRQAVMAQNEADYSNDED